MKTHNTHNQKRLAQRNSKGFTLVETLVAIFILILTISTLISLSAGSFLNVRYAKNQITANMLAQEMVEYIRSTRDSAVQADPENGFTTWTDSIASCTNISRFWCDIDQFRSGSGTILISGVTKPSQDCRGKACFGFVPTFLKPKTLLQYSSGEFISNSEFLTGGQGVGAPQPSPFSRGVKFIKYGADQIEVVVRIEWKNGSVDKFFEQTIMLARW